MGKLVESSDDINALAQTNITELVNSSFREAIESVPDDLIDLSEEDLQAKANATDSDWMLRYNFWKAFYRTVENPGKTVGKIQDHQIYSGVVNKRTWFRRIKKPEKVAFIVRPIYNNDLDSFFDLAATIASQRLLEILRLPLEKKKDYDNTRINGILKACQIAFDRKMGKAIERSMVRLHSTSDKPPEAMSNDEINEELKTLLAEVGSADD